MTVKFSELSEGDLINHDGEVINKRQAMELIKSGNQRSALYTVSDNWVDQALKSAWRDSVEEVDDDVYTAPDPDAELIEVDRLD